MQLKISSIEEIDEDYIMHYVNSVKKGREVDKRIREKETSASGISFRDKLNLYTYQFYEYWLNDYEMEEIDFITRQFPWLVEDNR